MNCENKELFRNCIVIPCCWPQRFFSLQHWPRTKRVEKKTFLCFYFLFGLISTSSITSWSLSLNHRLHFAFIFDDLEGIPRVFVQTHTESRLFLFFFLLPSLPLFSLAGSVSLPRDSPVLCSRYRPIDFGRERKYCGHDSPCMNLMIPVLSVLPFQWRREKINRTAFLSSSLQACQ